MTILIYQISIFCQLRLIVSDLKRSRNGEITAVCKKTPENGKGTVIVRTKHLLRDFGTALTVKKFTVDPD